MEAEAVKNKRVTAREAVCMVLIMLAMLMAGVWRTDIS